MLASFPASMVNQKRTDLGIPNRFNLSPSCSNLHRQRMEETMTTQHKFEQPTQASKAVSLVGAHNPKRQRVAELDDHVLDRVTGGFPPGPCAPSLGRVAGSFPPNPC
jgi:hypothetical protein